MFVMICQNLAKIKLLRWQNHAIHVDNGRLNVMSNQKLSPHLPQPLPHQKQLLPPQPLPPQPLLPRLPLPQLPPLQLHNHQQLPQRKQHHHQSPMIKSLSKNVISMKEEKKFVKLSHWLIWIHPKEMNMIQSKENFNFFFEPITELE